MAGSNLNQIVLDAFRQANGNTGIQGDVQNLVQELVPRSGDNLSSALTDASRQIDALRSVNQTLSEVLKNNTQAVVQNSAAQNGKGAAGTVGSIASTILGSGLGLVPLISSLTHLFGGGNSAPAPTSIPYVAPNPLRLDLGDTAQSTRGIGSFAPIGYGQNGLPRLTQEEGAARSPAGAAHISIQVNAIDSRSFMDHSYEIAQAVRQAMLNSHSLNDVVSDL
ncbi:MAG TPA: hypothetical protein VL285_09065 [Bryobacteraceae bacterium]|jgi:hypothetical protein|nr:hypothetical protein [Bryobacteraceae bacterium]